MVFPINYFVYSKQSCMFTNNLSCLQCKLLCMFTNNLSCLQCKLLCMFTNNNKNQLHVICHMYVSVIRTASDDSCDEGLETRLHYL